MNIIVIDTETTNRYPERALILKVAAVVLVDGKITNQFTSLVNRREDELFDAAEAMEVNGITRDMLQGAPEPAFVRGLLHDFIRVNDGRELTSFNVQYDRTVLYVNQWEVPGSIGASASCSRRPNGWAAAGRCPGTPGTETTSGRP